MPYFLLWLHLCVCVRERWGNMLITLIFLSISLHIRMGFVCIWLSSSSSSFFCIYLEFGFVDVNCHCDLWRCQKINHLNLTSLHILQTNHLLHGFFVWFICLFIRRWFCKLLFSTVCCWFVSSQRPDALQTNQNEANEAIEREEGKKTILIAAKCLIFVRRLPQLGNRTKKHVQMIWQRG